MWSIIDQIAIFGLRNRRHHPFRFWRYQVRSGDGTLIYEGRGGRKSGRLPGLARGWWLYRGGMSAVGWAAEGVTGDHRGIEMDWQQSLGPVTASAGGKR